MIKRFMMHMLLALIMAVSSTAISQAQVKITGISISTRILLDIYKAVEQGQSLSRLNPNVLIMTAVSDETRTYESWEITIKIYDGQQWVGGVDIGVGPLKPGVNRYNASQFNVDNSQPQFNDNYKPSFNVDDFASGGILPINNFKIVITPKPEPSGPPYTLSLGLFAPRAAMNRPAVPIYPRDVAINTMLPTFSWMPAGNGQSYEVLVSPDIDPKVNNYWTSARVSSTQVTYDGKARALKPNTKYYWKVIAYNSTGQAVGGNLGHSQVAWFKINQTGRIGGAMVTPEEVDRVVRPLIKDKKIVDTLKNYRAVSVASDSDDLADLLNQLKNGSAKIINQQLN